MRLYCELKTKRDKDIARVITNDTYKGNYLVWDGEGFDVYDVWHLEKQTKHKKQAHTKVSLPELLRTALAGQEDVVRDIANILNGKDEIQKETDSN